MAKSPARPRSAVAKKPKDDGIIRGGAVTDSEKVSALSNPAYIVNTILPMRQKGIIRIAFGESVGDDETVFHTSIAMTYEVAEILVEAVRDSLEKAKAEIDDEDD